MACRRAGSRSSRRAAASSARCCRAPPIAASASKLVSTGNEADLDSTDFIEHLLEDDATAVIAVYMEGLRRPEAFRSAALRAAALRKPIVVFKVGRSESGGRA